MTRYKMRFPRTLLRGAVRGHAVAQRLERCRGRANVREICRRLVTLRPGALDRDVPERLAFDAGMAPA
jgi:hypothetical protein